MSCGPFLQPISSLEQVFFPSPPSSSSGWYEKKTLNDNHASLESRITKFIYYFSLFYRRYNSIGERYQCRESFTWNNSPSHKEIYRCPETSSAVWRLYKKGRTKQENGPAQGKYIRHALYISSGVEKGEPSSKLQPVNGNLIFRKWETCAKYVFHYNRKSIDQKLRHKYYKIFNILHTWKWISPKRQNVPFCRFHSINFSSNTSCGIMVCSKVWES